MFKRKLRRSREFKKNSQVVDLEEARQKRRDKRAMAIAEAQLREEEKARREKQREETAKKRARRTRRRMVYTAIVCSILITIGFSAFNIISLTMERRALRQEQEQLIKTRDELQHELENASSPEYIEQQARTHLRLIKPGEVLYILPKSDTDTDTDEENDDSQ